MTGLLLVVVVVVVVVGWLGSVRVKMLGC